MIEGLTVYNYFFEIIVITALFMFPVQRKEKFWLRLVVCLAEVGVIWYVLLFVVPETWLALNVAKYILLFCAIVAAIWGIWKVDVGQAIYSGVTVYAVQHVIIKINVFVRLAISMNSGRDLLWLYYILVPACLIVAYFAVLRPLQKDTLKFDSSFQVVTAIFLLIVTTFISLAFDWKFSGELPRVYLAFICCDVLCAVLVLVVQFCTFRLSRKDVEILEVERMMRIEKQQYLFSKDLIERINIKSHDLKHQMMESGKLSVDERRETLEAISLYDDIPRTGNVALDTTLVVKKPIFDKENIVFTCMADAVPDFMKPSDLYSLFGNILDNAIEANRGLEKNSRYCVLIIKPNGDNLSIHEENEYAGQICTDAFGMPISAKEDKFSHGFGLKSIAAIVKKYGGELAISTADNVFTLDILIPVKQCDSSVPPKTEK